MIRIFLLALGMIVAVLVICELIGLGYLYYGLKAWPDYWRGRANQPGEFIYVALGDSAAQGVGASRPNKGYVGLIADQIQQSTGKKVRVINLSKSGAKLQDALRDQVPLLDQYKADLVTVEIGANDMGGYTSSNAGGFRKDYEKLLQSLPPGKSVVSDMPYFGGRPGWTSNSHLANTSIHQLAAQYNVPVAPLFDKLAANQTPLIYASDFFHPSDRGYRIWLEAFQPAIKRTIQ